MQSLINACRALAQFDPSNFFTWGKGLTATGILAGMVIAFMRRWLVPGWLYDQAVAENIRLRQELDAQRRIGMQMASTAEVVAKTADTVAQSGANAKGPQ